MALGSAIVVIHAGTALHALRGYSHEDLSGHAAGADDAYISYRYARNLASGDGPLLARSCTIPSSVVRNAAIWPTCNCAPARNRP